MGAGHLCVFTEPDYTERYKYAEYFVLLTFTLEWMQY